jgi:hypothetical protein
MRRHVDRISAFLGVACWMFVSAMMGTSTIENEEAGKCPWEVRMRSFVVVGRASSTSCIALHQCVPTIVVPDAPEIHLKFHPWHDIVSASVTSAGSGILGISLAFSTKKKARCGMFFGRSLGDRKRGVRKYADPSLISRKCECLNRGSLSRGS